MDKGQGDKERNTNPSGLAGDWVAGRCRQGGGVDMRATEEGRGREGPLEEKTHRGWQGPVSSTRTENGVKTDEGHGIHMHAARNFWGREGPAEQVKDGKGGKRELIPSGLNRVSHFEWDLRHL